MSRDRTLCDRVWGFLVFDVITLGCDITKGLLRSSRLRNGVVLGWLRKGAYSCGDTGSVTKPAAIIYSLILAFFLLSAYKL
jgi:hypothetical protein